MARYICDPLLSYDGENVMVGVKVPDTASKVVPFTTRGWYR